MGVWDTTGWYQTRSWHSEAARLPAAAATWSRRYDPLLWHEVKGAHGLGSLGQQTGTSEPPPDGLAGETQTLAQPLRFLRRGPLNRTPRILMHDSDCKRSEAYTPDIR